MKLPRSFQVLALLPFITFHSATAQIQDPRDVAGCTLWLDAADADGDFTTGGNFVDGTRWIDKSPQANAHALHPTPSNRPRRLLHSRPKLRPQRLEHRPPGDHHPRIRESRNFHPPRHRETLLPPRGHPGFISRIALITHAPCMHAWISA